MKNNRWITIAWIFQIILGLLFLAAGAGKFLAQEIWIEKFSNWGFPENFYLLIGFVEIVAAILLFIPKIAAYAATVLLAVMMGAAITHIIHQEFAEILRPGIFMFLLFALIYSKRQYTLRAGGGTAADG